uniref:Reverse transcriptase domain-containing protein n=1 Tax=Tanacetum cinerariifolium TaxID=118510 RepID=A0A699JZE6_TANCI|nr:hypothetical protein [Tanacetum cinerariifolium]
MLDSRRPISGMTTTGALVVIQEMDNHSHKWHEGGSIRGLRGNSSNGKSVITNKLNDLGRGMRKLKESVHTIQENVMKVGEMNKTPKQTPVIGTFASKVKRRIAEEQERTFMESLENVPANTSLIDTLRKTPNYTKSLQELVSKKKRIEEVSMVKLNARCSAVLQNELPSKEKDPGPMLATAHARIDVFGKKILLETIRSMETWEISLELDDLFLGNRVKPFGVPSDSKSDMGIVLNDFSGNQKDLLDEQAPQFRQNVVKNKREKDKIRTKPDQIKKKREAWKSPEVSKTNHNQDIRKKKKIQSPGTKTDKP